MRLNRILPLLLAGSLQVMPMLRAVLPAVQARAFAPSAWAIIFKIGSGAIAMFGYHAISSATVFIPGSGSTFNLMVGVTTNLIIAYSGSHTPGSWSASPNPVCPGMTLAKGSASTTISGTPTTAGSFNATVTAWSGTSTSGDSGSASYTFNVAAPPGNAPVITNITVTPSASVAPGTTVTFTPSVGGTAPLSYRWYFNNVPVFGGTNATLTQSSVQSSNAGNYKLIVGNYYGSATNTSALTVTGPPAITSQPQDQYVAAGGTASFTITAGGAATLAYQWYKDGTALAGKTTAALSVTSAQTTNAGRYWVVVTNSLGSATSSIAFLRLSPSSTAATAPIFALSKSWRYNTNGLDFGNAWREFDFNDAAWPSGNGILGKEDSGNPAVFPYMGTLFPSTSNGVYFVTNYYFRTHFTITNKAQVTSLILSNYIDDGAVFYLNGTEAFRFNMPAGSVTATTFASASLTEGVFTVSNLPTALLVSGDNVLSVEVHQINATSSDEVMGAALIGTFAIPNTVPLILTNPVGQSVTAGTNVTFTAAADGTAPLTLQWYRGSTLVGSGSTTLTLNSVQPGDTGAYTLVVGNSYGSVTSLVANLTVAPSTPPTILTQPLSQIVTVSSNVSFSVTATNATSYQWRFNSNNIAGATTNTYAIVGAAVTNSGFYSVIVSNSAGSVPSTNAQLLVVVAPSPTVAPRFNPLTVSAGQFALSFTTLPGYRYLVQTNSNLGTANWGTISNIPPSFIGANVSFPQPANAPQLFYRVTISNN